MQLRAARVIDYPRGTRTDDQARISNWLASIRYRAKKRGVPCTLRGPDLEEMLPPDMVCPVLGVEMRWGDKDYGPSVDQILPSEGYTKENCMVMCMKANRIKSNATPEEIRLVAEFLGD